jgi:hypothetical protein
MDASTIIALVTCIITGLLVMGGGVTWLLRMQAAMSIMEVKMESLWRQYSDVVNAVMRRGLIAGLETGAIREHSPIKPSPEARLWFSPELCTALRDLRATLPTPVTEEEMYVAVESHLGERIMREVTLAHKGEDATAIVLAAVGISKEVPGTVDPEMTPGT